MRICVLATPPLSFLKYRREVIQKMVLFGHEVIAVGPVTTPEIRESVRQLGAKYVEVPLERTGMNPLRDLATFRGYRKALRRLQPDLVFSSTVKPVIYGSFAARSAGVKNIFSLLSGLGFGFYRRTRLQRALGLFIALLYKMALAFNEKVIFQNPDDRDLFLKERLISTSDKCVVVNGSGVDLERFNMVPPVISPVTFLFLGRLYEEKGIYEFISAARIVKAAFPETCFHVLGSREKIPTAVPQHDIDAWVNSGLIQLTSWADDVRPHISRCSVLVLPSYREGTPRSVLEAMSMGRPIVTTDAPGCRETVVNGDNGFLVPLYDPGALAEAMLTFVRTPALIASMGVRSRLMAEEKFDVEKVNESMMKAMNINDLRHESPGVTSQIKSPPAGEGGSGAA